ncbi:MAG: FG-GAP repeat protein, partial [Pseudomonadota bacterium]|nr:FG-GAP repeat protein [Pseudomonadota bacterium]
MFHVILTRARAYCRPDGSLAGFSLLELSIVLIVIALIAGSGMMMGQSIIDSARIAQTNNKLDTIEKALYAYRMANNRLPCPGELDLAATSVNYGVEAANNGGTCIGGTPTANYSYTIPKGNTTATADGTTVVEGSVPIKALNLPIEYMVDGWGRKIGYAVWTPMTVAGRFITYGIAPNCGGITVNDAVGANRATVADYALISYGRDGHGAWLPSGARYNAGSTNTDEQANAHYNNLGVDTGYKAVYVQKDPTLDPNDTLDVFDDFVRYRERWQLQNAYDGYKPIGQPCTSGFVANGYASNQSSGASVAVADVNGDGIPDLIIGVPFASPGTPSNAGSVFVVFGTAYGFPDPLPLNSLNGTNGFELDGAAPGYSAGWSVAAGDVNGDGIPDLIIGAPFASLNGVSDVGSVYVVFGGATRKDGTSWTSCPCTLNASFFLNGTNGVEFDGAAVNNYTGGSVAVGDVNGDGIADVVIGADHAAVGAGSVYVVFGKKTGWPGATTLGSAFLNGTNGVEFDGTAGSYVGTSVATGDVNGDTVTDLIIGARYASPGGVLGAGSVYVVFGKETGWSGTATALSAAFLNGVNGIEFDGTAANEAVGLSVAAGDVNGDGVADIIIGADTSSGAVYMVFGGSTRKDGTGWTSCPCTLNASFFLNGTNGVE